MSFSLQKSGPELNNQILQLEREIAALEKTLSESEQKVNVFTAQIRNQLQPQIKRIQELVALYKKQKQEKKAKRLEQKKKGKHYQPPQQFPSPKNARETDEKTPEPNQQDLKRLYKEAIVQVHPDKFVNEDESKTERAHELTLQLNELYESGDLEELKGFHEHILSGNAMAHIPFKTASLKDPVSMLTYLQNKRAELLKNLQEIKTSELFQVLETYENPLTFIPELRLQFEARIAVFEKRTRQKKNKGQ